MNDPKKTKEDKKAELKQRVLKCRSELISLGVKKPLDLFVLKYSSFAGDDKKVKRLNNLWYGYITDDDFTKKLEAFVEFKKVEY